VLIAEPDVPALPEAVALGAGEEEEPELELVVEELDGAGVAGAAGAGCIAEDPVVAEPEALAAGRSVPPEGAGVV
jgi:hypothetical protein